MRLDRPSVGKLFRVADRQQWSRSKLPPGERAVAVRLRQAREAASLSLAELAAESGTTKSSLKNWEYGVAPLPLAAGNRICQRLNIYQRWLATGISPREPYADFSQFLAIVGSSRGIGRLTFFQAYSGPMDAADLPISVALGELPKVELRMVSRASISHLEAMLGAAIASLRSESNECGKRDSLRAIEGISAEIKRRLDAKNTLDVTAPLTQLSAMQISERLKNKRTELGLTRAKAAKAWGVSEGTLQNWEQGRRKPRGLALRQLEQILRTAHRPSS